MTPLLSCTNVPDCEVEREGMLYVEFTGPAETLNGVTHVEDAVERCTLWLPCRPSTVPAVAAPDDSSAGAGGFMAAAGVVTNAVMLML